jgi:hypothetical protein
MSVIDTLKKFAPTDTQGLDAAQMAALFEQAATLLKAQAAQMQRENFAKQFKAERKAKREEKLASFGTALQLNRIQEIDRRISAQGWVNSFRNDQTEERTFGLKEKSGYQLKVKGDNFSLHQNGVELLGATHITQLEQKLKEFKTRLK